MSVWRRVRLQTYGALLLAFVVGVVTAAVADYEHAFTRSVDVQVRSDRSGLLVYVGSDVTMRGVLVGKVRAIHATPDGAVLDVALSPDKVRYVPRDATADIQAPTVFGAKFVDLALPAGADGPVAAADRIRAGDVIMPTAVATEVNDVFQNLIGVLQAVDPAKVQTILGTLSTALRGNGEHLGQTIVDTNTLTTELDRHLAALQVDLQRAAPVIDGYAKVAPALVTVLHNIGVTAVTLQQTQAQFQTALTSITRVVDTATGVITQNEPALRQTVAELQPTAQVLNTYAPTLACIVNGTVEMSASVAPILGGDDPGLHVFAGFLPGADGYDPAKDLPILDTTDGPDCLGGPIGSTVVDGHRVGATTGGVAVTPYPRISFRDGTTTAFGGRTDCLSAPNTGGTCASAAGGSGGSGGSAAPSRSGVGLLDQLMGSGVIGR